MRNLILISIIITLSLGAKAQSISEILIGNTWQVTSLILNEEPFVDTLGTCLYSTTIYFVDETQLITNSTCKESSHGTYNTIDDLLIVNETDTLQIVNIDANSFSTHTTRKAIIEQGGELYDEVFVEIDTYYEKE